MLVFCDNCNRSMETSIHDLVCINHYINNLYNARTSVHLCSDKCFKIHTLDYHTPLDIV